MCTDSNAATKEAAGAPEHHMEVEPELLKEIEGLLEPFELGPYSIEYVARRLISLVRPYVLRECCSKVPA